MANILNLPDWNVLSVEGRGEYRIHAEYEPDPAFCPHCGVVGPSAYRHANEMRPPHPPLRGRT